jgi:hypothetical protein
MPAKPPEAAPSFLGFTPIKRIKSRQDPAGLTPKGRFIAVKARLANLPNFALDRAKSSGRARAR